jgi:hypothetical protein
VGVASQVVQDGVGSDDGALVAKTTQGRARTWRSRAAKAPAAWRGLA